MNPWLHFGTTVHNPISARFRDDSTLKVGSPEKKTRLLTFRQTWVTALNNKRNQRNSAINQKLEDEKSAKLAAAKEKEQKRECILNAKRLAQEKEVQERKCFVNSYNCGCIFLHVLFKSFGGQCI